VAAVSGVVVYDALVAPLIGLEVSLVWPRYH
jgi:hypothetical protein